MTNEEAFFSSVYHVLGLAYDWNTTRLAEIYKTTSPQFELWLSEIGVPDDIIKLLSNREPFGEGFCRRCGIKTTEEYFCSDGCAISYLYRNYKQDLYMKTGIINTTDIKYKYNVNTGEVVSD